MSGAPDWPIKDKPTTNGIIQMMLMIALGVLLGLYPVPVIAIAVAAALFFGIRSIARDLCKEWRRP